MDKQGALFLLQEMQKLMNGKDAGYNDRGMLE
jgi:hypothetical protein